MQQLPRPRLLNWSMVRLWLSLLVLGIAFWSIGQLMTRQILGRTYQTPRYIITDIQSKDISQPEITAIRVEIDPENNVAAAKVISENPALQARKLQFNLTTPEKIEQALSEKLDIPPQDVSNLVHYKVKSLEDSR